MNDLKLEARSLPPDLTINLIFGLSSGILAVATIIQAAYVARLMIRRAGREQDADTFSNVELGVQGGSGDQEAQSADAAAFDVNGSIDLSAETVPAS